jgi:hypothetical protein
MTFAVAIGIVKPNAALRLRSAPGHSSDDAQMISAGRVLMPTGALPSAHLGLRSPCRL